MRGVIEVIRETEEEKVPKSTIIGACIDDGWPQHRHSLWPITDLLFLLHVS